MLRTIHKTTHKTTRVHKTITRCCLAIAILLAYGCASPGPSYDQSLLREARPRSIVVLPPMNNSIEVNASYTYLSTISRPLAEKGYYVFPVAVIDAFLKENGLPTPAEMNNIPLDKIRQHIGADAVLYITINDWGQKYNIISSQTVVSASLTLVDTRTGEQLWQGRAQATKGSNNNNNGGIGGLLVSAIVDQIAGSIIDHTYGLSGQANEHLIWGNNGPINGPYRPEELD